MTICGVTALLVKDIDSTLPGWEFKVLCPSVFVVVLLLLALAV